MRMPSWSGRRLVYNGNMSGAGRHAFFRECCHRAAGAMKEQKVLREKINHLMGGARIVV